MTGLADGSVEGLGLLEQSGAQDDPGTYVAFKTPDSPYLGYLTFSLPGRVRPKLFSSISLQVNFKSLSSSRQTWTWSIYDWRKRKWAKIGEAFGSNQEQWQALTFGIGSPKRYVSRSGEIRIQLQSDNADGDAKIDYEVMQIIYRSGVRGPGLPPPILPQIGTVTPTFETTTPTLVSSPSPTPTQ